MSDETKNDSAPTADPATETGTAAGPSDAPAAQSAAEDPEASPPEGKKKKKKATEPTASDDSEEGKALREAEVAFEVGDYRRARELATKLAGSSRAPIADAGRDLLRRTDADPVQMAFLALCACALIGIAYYYLGH
jgi:hypothetical protein